MSVIYRYITFWQMIRENLLNTVSFYYCWQTTLLGQRAWLSRLPNDYLKPFDSKRHFTLMCSLEFSQNYHNFWHMFLINILEFSFTMRPQFHALPVFCSGAVLMA